MAMAVPATVADASVKINCPVCDVSSWFKVPYDSQVQSALEVFGENIEAICPFCSAKLYVHANDILPSLNEVEILPDEEGEAESHNICCGRCIIENGEIVDEVITIRFNDENANVQFYEILEAENRRSVQEIAHEHSGEYKELDYIFRDHNMYHQYIETDVELTGDNPIHALRKGRKFDVAISEINYNFALMILGDIDEYGKFVEKLTFEHSLKCIQYKGYFVRMVTGYYKKH